VRKCAKVNTGREGSALKETKGVNVGTWMKREERDSGTTGRTNWSGQGDTALGDVGRAMGGKKGGERVASRTVMLGGNN